MTKELYKKIKRPLFSVIAALSLWFIFPLTVLHLIPLLLGAFYFISFSPGQAYDRTVRVVSAVTAALFSSFTLLANLSNILVEDAFFFSLFRIIIGFWGIFLFYDAILRFFYQKTASFSIIKKEKRSDIRPVYIFLFSFAAMLLIYGIFFLRFYPGILSPDSLSQLQQVMGLAPYSNHHPLFHTFFIKLFYALGFRLFGNVNAAIATFSVFQMLFLSLLYSYFLFRLYKLSVNRGIIVLVFLFFASVPYNIIFSFTMWKDVPFGGVSLLISLLLWETLNLPLSKTGYILRYVALFLSGIGFCLLRTNGFYAFLVALPFLSVALYKKRRSAILILPLAFAVSFLIRGPLYDTLGVSQPDAAEHLSIPLQQIGRTIADGKPLTGEQREELESYLPVDRVAEVYYPHISDNMKDLVRHEGDLQYLTEHSGNFLKLWLDIGLSNPHAYLVGFIDSTMGYWYPDVRWGIYPPHIYENDLGAYSDPQIGVGVANVIDTYVAPASVPFYAQLTGCGYAIWTMFVLIGVTVIRKNRQALFIFFPVFCIWLSLLVSTPVFADFRYIYPVFTTLPLLLIAAFYPSKDQPEDTLSMP